MAKNFIWILIVAGFAVLAVMMFRHKTPDTAGITPNPGLKIETVTPAEFEQKLAALKGKAVLLNFWATWCPPCVAEVPDLVRLHEKYSAKGLVVIGFSMDDKSTEFVRDFAAGLGITYPVFYSQDADDIAAKYGFTNAIPYTVIFGVGGRQEKSFIGARSYEDFESAILPLLPDTAQGASPPPVGTTVQPHETKYDLKIVIVGPKTDARTIELAEIAEIETVSASLVVVIKILDPAIPDDKKTIAKEGLEVTDTPAAHACTAKTCFPPTTSPDELRQFIGAALKNK